MKIILTLSLLMLSASSWSQSATEPLDESSNDRHKLQIGLAGVASQSIYLGGNSQSRFFPAIDYQFNRFYFQAGDLGVKLIEKDNWEVDFGLGVNLAGDTDRGKSKRLNHLPELSFPINAFVSAQYTTKFGVFKVKHHHEINNKHDGNSSSLSYLAPVRRGQWLIVPQLSYEHHSEEVVNYFYGVNSIDATAAIPSYQTGSANNWQLSLLGLLKINSKWSFVGSVQNEFIGDAISNSPIVDDNQRLSLFAGFLYQLF